MPQPAAKRIVGSQEPLEEIMLPTGPLALSPYCANCSPASRQPPTAWSPRKCYAAWA